MHSQPDYGRKYMPMFLAGHAGQSRLDNWGDEYPTTQYALQGVGLVAMSHIEQSREVPMFIWHDVVEGDADAVD